MLSHVVVHLLLFIFVLTIIVILLLTLQVNCISEFFIMLIVRDKVTLALFIDMILTIQGIIKLVIIVIKEQVGFVAIVLIKFSLFLGRQLLSDLLSSAGLSKGYYA